MGGLTSKSKEKLENKDDLSEVIVIKLESVLQKQFSNYCETYATKYLDISRQNFNDINSRINDLEAEVLTCQNISESSEKKLFKHLIEIKRSITDLNCKIEELKIYHTNKKQDNQNLWSKTSIDTKSEEPISLEESFYIPSRGYLTGKHLKFINTALEGMSVYDLAGIGEALGGRLKSKGYNSAKDVYNVFLSLNGNDEKFKNWLWSVCGANSLQTDDCYGCLVNWRKINS